jgi:hypothetical protein
MFQVLLAQLYFLFDSGVMNEIAELKSSWFDNR